MSKVEKKIGTDISLVPKKNKGAAALAKKISACLLEQAFPDDLETEEYLDLVSIIHKLRYSKNMSRQDIRLALLDQHALSYQKADFALRVAGFVFSMERQKYPELENDHLLHLLENNLAYWKEKDPEKYDAALHKYAFLSLKIQELEQKSREEEPNELPQGIIILPEEEKNP